MYTRNYSPQEDKITVPENYVGNAFDTGDREIHKSEPTQEGANFTPQETDSEAVMKRTNSFDSIFRKLPFSNFFSGFDFLKGSFDGFGTEEILIIGVALFLLFGKNGDRECAVILLLLLFVK